MNTYTAFVVDEHYETRQCNNWVEAIQARDVNHARVIAEEQCARAWGCKPHEVACTGVVEGDINVLYWDDSADSAHIKSEGDHHD